MMSDWGVHLNDIVLWALDAKAPKSVCATGGIFTTDDDRDTPDTLQVIYEFPGLHPDLLDAQGERPEVQRPRLRHPLLRHRRQPAARPRGLRDHPRQDRPALRDQAASTAIARSGRSTSRPRQAKGVDGQAAHVKNFLECLKTRRRPTCDIEIGHRSTNTCHLGNIAYRLGRKLDWDDETETFKNDPEANALLKREPRKGYELPEV